MLTPLPWVRVNLFLLPHQVVLQLKVMGIRDPAEFDYITPPSSAALRKAFQTLVLLGALDKTGAVTPDGSKMAHLPLDPSFAHLVVRCGTDCNFFTRSSLFFPFILFLPSLSPSSPFSLLFSLSLSPSSCSLLHISSA